MEGQVSSTPLTRPAEFDARPPSTTAYAQNEPIASNTTTASVAVPQLVLINTIKRSMLLSK
jgi:hypothetical protein